MDNKDIPVSSDTRENRSRSMNIGLLGAGFMAICLLFIIAFIGFRPDQLSLTDRYFPSPTNTSTRTPTSTPTPNLTATQMVIQTTATAQAVQSTIADAQNRWSVLLSDNFTSNTNGWSIGDEDDEYAKIARTIDSGVYQWDATAKKGFISWIDANTISTTDFYLTVEAQRISGTSSSDYGLIFRQDIGTNFYYFGVDNDSFHVSLNYNNEWLDVIDWTVSSVIVPEGPNRLTVIANGTNFIFLINDQYVAEAIDDHISKGTTAIAIQIHSRDRQAVFEFDNFELREP